MVTELGRAVRVTLLLACAWSVFFATCPTQQAFGEQQRYLSSGDLATLRDLESLSVSPDGAWVAFLTVQADVENNRYNTAWHVTPTRRSGGSGESARRLGEAGDLHPAGALGLVGVMGSHRPPAPPVWSPDSEWITYLRWDGAGSQIWRSHRSGRTTEQLTHGNGHVRSLVYGREGARILYETEPSLVEFYASLEDEGKAGYLFDGRFAPAYDRRPVFPAEARFIEGTSRRHSAVAISMRRIWVYDPANRRSRRATDAERAEFEMLTKPMRPEARSIRGEFASSPNGALAWTEAHDPERQGFRPPLTVVARRVGSREAVVCIATECANQTIRNLWWRNDEELVFERREGPQDLDTGVYEWKVGDPAVRPIFRTSGRLTEIGKTCAVATDRLICFYEEAATPRRLISLDLDTGAIEILYNANPHFAQFDLGPRPQRLEFRKSSSAEAYYGYIVFPPTHHSSERLPLIIVTYRCSGFLRGGVGDEYPIYPFAAEGFAVLCMELEEDLERQARVDPRSHERWAWGPGIPAKQQTLDSFATAIARLDEMQLIDPSRVGITGLSRGAQLVGWALTDLPLIAAAITSGSPGTGGTSTYYLAEESMRDHLEDFYQLNAPNKTPERWREVSFSENVERVRAPLLINAADHEMMEALEPVVALRDAGRAVEMYVYPDEYHLKWQPAHRLAIYQRNIDWMNFWLRGVEDPDPKKSTQYARWRALRRRVEALPQ